MGDAQEAWSDDCQKNFKEKLAHLTASARFPLNWVTNPEFIDFCQTFISGAHIPSQKTLMQRIIPSTLKKVRMEI